MLKKIFLEIILTMMIFIFGQNNFANAQDVYAGNTGGFDFYVDTNSIYLKNEESFYVNVKKVDEKTGRLKETIRWHFFVSYHEGGRGEGHIRVGWSYDGYFGKNEYELSSPVDYNHIAQKILDICKSFNKEIAP